MRYVCIDSKIVENRGLKPIDKLLYGLLLFYQGEKKYCSAAKKMLNQTLGCSVSTIENSLKALEAIGLIRIVRGEKVAFDRHETNRYYVERVESGEGFLLVDADVLSLRSLNSTDKLLRSYLRFRIGGNIDCWPDQREIAMAIGVCRRTVIRSIARLEGQNMIQARHKRGGRRNSYGMTLMIPSPKLLPSGKKILAKSYVTKSGTCNNNFKETTLKYRKPAFGEGLSFLDPKQKAFDRLCRHGIRRIVAKSLVFFEHTPLPSIHQAIDNGLALEAWQRHNGKYSFRLQGYIMNTLKAARREAAIVRPTRLHEELKQLASIPRWQESEEALTDKEFAEQKDSLLAGIARKLAG